jgi:acyl carrier protein
MANDDYQADLLGFVCRNFLVEADEIDVGSSLVDQGIIDSFGLIEIATFMKSRYGISTEESEMNKANFGSIAAMAGYVRRKRDG